MDLLEKSKWAMIFADDLALYDRESDGMEDRLEGWRKHLEDAGLKLSTCH